MRAQLTCRVGDNLSLALCNHLHTCSLQSICGFLPPFLLVVSRSRLILAGEFNYLGMWTRGYAKNTNICMQCSLTIIRSSPVIISCLGYMHNTLMMMTSPPYSSPGSFLTRFECCRERFAACPIMLSNCNPNWSIFSPLGLNEWLTRSGHLENAIGINVQNDLCIRVFLLCSAQTASSVALVHVSQTAQHASFEGQP